jgi:hypothetical protein
MPISSRTSTQKHWPDDVSSKGPSFGWDDGQLILFDGSVRRHVVSAAVIPVLLDLGLGFFDPDCEQITAAPFGLPIEHEDELDFFALEMQSRRVLSGALSGLPIALYGLLCNYGRSYLRPLIGLLITVVIGGVLFLSHFGLAKYPRAIGLSLANTFGVLGFRKDFIDAHEIETLSRGLKVLSGVQTVAGVGLIFLFGLALRNRFRMR